MIKNRYIEGTLNFEYLIKLPQKLTLITNQDV